MAVQSLDDAVILFARHHGRRAHAPRTSRSIAAFRLTIDHLIYQRIDLKDELIPRATQLSASRPHTIRRDIF